MPNHFGVTVLEGKRGLKLTREKYAIESNKNSFSYRFSADIYADKEGRLYSDEWCTKQLEDCLKNYDLSMEYFSLLSHDEFNIEINKFLESNKCFVEVFDLNLYDQKSGYYIMVLDEYYQVYIGTTDNIKRRIRQHWSNSKSFDRLLCPMGAIDSSILSSDSFRALDTTRIFAYTTKRTFDREDKFINQFSAKFVCNRLAGGKITGGLLQSITMMKNRNLK
ncbi:GIY-YIG nuclease family protein [Clostridium gasigenes]|uniref:GIY-YIG nuclease family protein n=1 Tax=Clostridium gasigenes TaxID=94869 RepID=UPI001438260B|nr:GIY-YIG nuclease family protein [Clostridium gasigenes]NKF05284.1 GIY-YIG nuclease family protein [Clostridium gasigenes]QSW18739.1 GIY-YIG nuclease family protein [Clostridium gasigenes]